MSKFAPEGKACWWKNTGGSISATEEFWLKVRNWPAASADIAQWDGSDGLVGMRAVIELLKSIVISWTCW